MKIEELQEKLAILKTRVELAEDYELSELRKEYEMVELAIDGWKLRAARQAPINPDDKITIEVIKGVEGCCLAINDYRIAGPKPWGGGTVIHQFKVSKQELANQLQVEL